jgi:hypothetical protein
MSLELTVINTALSLDSNSTDQLQLFSQLTTTFIADSNKAIVTIILT